MTIDLNVLNHLGIHLYSNIPAVLSEVVANAWDADAEEVHINIDVEKDVITIEDTGHGMSVDDINNKYLTVGYARRAKGESKTPKYNRDVMGRKGIGKLSLFSIADHISIYTIQEGGELNAFLLDSIKIQGQITSDNDEPYFPEELDVTGVNLEKGTRIILTKLKKKVNRAETALRKRLARRFSIIGVEYTFRVYINTKEISIEDRDYFHKVQYLWYYGDDSKKYEAYSTNAEKVEPRNENIGDGLSVSGWMGLTKESSQLQDERDNLNKIPLIIRGKMAKEDMLEEFREGGLYAKYLFGEIKADFLDKNDAEDITITNRQGIVVDDERYIALHNFLWDELKHIQRKREEYKSEEGEREAIKIAPIEKWYTSLTGDTKKKAKSLFSKISQITVDDEHQRELFAHGVMAFESFRYKDALNTLENISTENLDEFLNIFKEFDEIEATLYYKITKERLQVIENLKEKVHEENALEEILRDYLYEHLWLLDPAWDRATENPYMEEQVRKEFKGIDAGLSEDEMRGRVDIRYKKTSGKHIIIELKRASVKTEVNTLLTQVRKYQSALKKLLRKSGESQPTIETICVVGKPLKEWEDLEIESGDRQQMAVRNTQLITYQQLINDAYNSYKEYLDKHKEAGKLLTLIKEIEAWTSPD